MSLQIKAKQLAFLLLLFPSISYPESDFRTCSEVGLKILYINGVLTDYDMAFATASVSIPRMLDSSKTKLDHKKVSVDFVHNYSTVKWENKESEGGYLDYWECIHLKARELTSRSVAGFVSSVFGFVPNSIINEEAGTEIASQIQAHLNDYSPSAAVVGPEAVIAEKELRTKTFNALVSGYKVLHLAHSQGGFIASSVASRVIGGVGGFESFKEYYAAVFLGTPISYLPFSNEKEKFLYLSAKQDLIARGLNIAGNALSPNMDVPELGNNLSDISIEGHSIDNTYLSNIRIGKIAGIEKPGMNHTFDLIKRAVSTLDNNDENCCNKRDGKLWVNESGCEGSQTTCQGGFLEKTVKLNLDSEDELQLSKDSVVCGDVKIETDRSNVKIEDSRINGPANIIGDVELKKVYLDATDNSSLEDVANFDGTNDKILIDFTSSTYSQPNILGRPQITGPVEIYSSEPETVITGSPTIKDRVKLHNSKITEIYPPEEKEKKLFSQIIIDGEFGEVQLTDSSLEGKVNISGPVTMFEVTQKGTATFQRANFTKTKLTNSYYSTETKPGIKVLNGTSCTSQLNLGAAEIKDEADIQACGDIYDSAKVTGHVQIKGEVAISGSLFGDPYVLNQVPMRITGSNDPNYGISIFPTAQIHNRPTISGDILFDDGTKIYNNGIYRGVKQLVAPGLTHFSHFNGGSYYGANDITGFYFIEKGLTNVEIVGSYAQFSNGTYLSTNIRSSASIGEGASLKGPMHIQGTIGPQTIVEGKNLGFRGGIFLDSGDTFTGVGKKLEGGVYLGSTTTVTGSDINGNALDPSHLNNFIEITGSDVTNSTITGAGIITGSDVSEANISDVSYNISNSTLLKGTYSKNISITNFSTIDRGSYTDNASIDSSTVTNSNLSGNVQVFGGASLTNTTAYGSAKLCNTSYVGGFYGSEYDCTAPPLTQMKQDSKDIVSEKILTAQRDAKMRHERVMKVRQQARRQLQSRLPASAFKKAI